MVAGPETLATPRSKGRRDRPARTIDDVSAVDVGFGMLCSRRPHSTFVRRAARFLQRRAQARFLMMMFAGAFIVACASRPGASATVRNAATEEVTSIALHEAITRSLRDVRRGADLEIVCVRVQVGDPSAAVLTALAASVPFTLRPFSNCRIDRSESPAFDRAQVVDAESGQRGMEIFAESLVFTSATAFTVRIGFFQHPEVAGRWTCAGRQSTMGWRVDRCDDE